MPPWGSFRRYGGISHAAQHPSICVSGRYRARRGVQQQLVQRAWGLPAGEQRGQREQQRREQRRRRQQRHRDDGNQHGRDHVRQPDVHLVSGLLLREQHADAGHGDVRGRGRLHRLVDGVLDHERVLWRRELLLHVHSQHFQQRDGR
jgi:hypothetical protein